MSTRQFSALTLCALAMGCGGTSGGGGGTGIGGDLGTGFELVQFGTEGGSLQNNSIWQLNRPIELVFNQPVDFASVNSSSINIRTLDGIPALGEFFVKTDATGALQPEVIVFQPRCPTEPDFSDSGLTAGGVQYELLVIGSDISQGLSVRSQAGTVLKNSQSRFFFTPSGSQSVDLFFDQVQGAPTLCLKGMEPPCSPFSYLERFEPDEAGGVMLTKTYLELESGMPKEVLNVPINLLSDPTQAIALVLEFNQPISPSAENLSASRIRLEYLDGAVWRAIPSLLSLEQNCSQSGARVRLRPVGILPQNSLVRLVLSSAFEDLIGQTNPLDNTNLARLRTANLSNPGFTDPGNLSDEIFIGFDSGDGNFQPQAPDFAEPAAVWQNGRLTASFDFLGTGGPGGNFDWRVPSGAVFTLNTNQTLTLVGGPGFFPSEVQQVVNGLVNVRNLEVEAGATIRVVGSNVARIFATGTIDIKGTIDVSGLDGPDVIQLNSPMLPKPGSAGVAGGGDGGVGTPVTTGSTAKGGPGFGAFKSSGKGGAGGNSGFNNSTTDTNWRGGGGGGGTFAVNSATGSLSAADAAEFGMNGSPNATDAVLGTKPPQGGDPGPSPFADADQVNDFFGVRLNPDMTFLQGELTQPWAGAGGGAGGDSIKAANFPAVPWNINNEKSGAGGGSGGGNLQVFAIGDILISGAGRILSNGGRGGRGESTNGINNVGGGSGGGSGGHLILQTAGALDLSASTGTPLSANGGAGGPGLGNQFSTGVSSGGDGGVGVIQVHVADPTADIKLPVGQTLATLTVPDAYTLIPTFGRRSKGRTTYIPLAGASLNPGTTLDRPLFNIAGIDQNEMIPDLENPGMEIMNPMYGRIETTGGLVNDQPALDITPAVVLSVDATLRRVQVDASSLLNDTSLPFSNDAYLRNTGLLRKSELSLQQGLSAGDYVVGSADFDTATGTLTLFLEPGGPVLTAFTTGSTFQLRPRFFRVITNNVLDSLPDSAAVTLRYQIVAADSAGLPDPEAIVVNWTSSLEDLNSPQITGGIDYLRMEFEFDLDANDTGLSANNPRPALDFSRLLFLF